MRHIQPGPAGIATFWKRPQEPIIRLWPQDLRARLETTMAIITGECDPRHTNTPRVSVQSWPGAATRKSWVKAAGTAIDARQQWANGGAAALLAPEYHGDASIIAGVTTQGTPDDRSRRHFPAAGFRASPLRGTRLRQTSSRCTEPGGPGRLFGEELRISVMDRGPVEMMGSETENRRDLATGRSEGISLRIRKHPSRPAAHIERVWCNPAFSRNPARGSGLGVDQPAPSVAVEQIRRNITEPSAALKREGAVDLEGHHAAIKVMALGLAGCGYEVGQARHDAESAGHPAHSKPEICRMRPQAVAGGAGKDALRAPVQDRPPIPEAAVTVRIGDSRSSTPPAFVTPDSCDVDDDLPRKAASEHGGDRMRLHLRRAEAH